MLKKFLLSICRSSCLRIAAGMAFSGHVTFAQNLNNVYVADLATPISIEVDARGWVWVAENGTGNSDARISVVTGPGKIYPFMTGLPSTLGPEGGPIGLNHLYFSKTGELIVLVGEGTDTLSETILLADTAGFTPGEPALTRQNIKEIVKVGEFWTTHFGKDTISNPYAMTYGQNGDWFIVDAALNSVVRRNAMTKEFSVFTTFPDITNSLAPLGAPVTNTVPTGIVYKDNSYFVCNLTGFPFANGAAKVYKINSAGNFEPHINDMTTLVDITFDKDSNLAVLNIGDFNMPPFAPRTGSVFVENMTTPLIDSLSMPTGLRFSQNKIFVSQMIAAPGMRTGNILLFDRTVLGSEKNLVVAEQETEVYPNPFNEKATVSFYVKETGIVKITLSDARSQFLGSVLENNMAAGRHRLELKGTDLNGKPLQNGNYHLKIEVNGKHSEIKKLMVIR